MAACYDFLVPSLFSSAGRSRTCRSDDVPRCGASASRRGSSEEKMADERTDKTGILGGPAGLARASEEGISTAESTGAVLGHVEERGAGAVVVASEGTIEAAKRVEREIRAGRG